MTVKRENIKSTAISQAIWDSDEHTLEVTFNGGNTYSFLNVSEEVFNDFINSPSPGQYYHKFIKGNYG